MDKSDVIKLVKTTYTLDAYGVRRPTTTEREVFCNAFSVSQTEFFKVGRKDLNPSGVLICSFSITRAKKTSFSTALTTLYIERTEATTIL